MPENGQGNNPVFYSKMRDLGDKKTPLQQALER